MQEGNGRSRGGIIGRAAKHMLVSMAAQSGKAAFSGVQRVSGVYCVLCIVTPRPLEANNAGHNGMVLYGVVLSASSQSGELRTSCRCLLCDPSSSSPPPPPLLLLFLFLVWLPLCGRFGIKVALILPPPLLFVLVFWSTVDPDIHCDRLGLLPQQPAKATPKLSFR